MTNRNTLELLTYSCRSYVWHVSSTSRK